MKRERVVPAGLTLMWCIALSSCAVPPQSSPFDKARLTAEEAAYYEDINPIATAACQIGTIDAVQYAAVTGMQMPGYGAGEGSRPWSDLHAYLESLLPPQGLENFHADLVATVAAQAQLAVEQPAQVMLERGSKLPEIDGDLSAHAQSACRGFNAFLDGVSSRPPAKQLPSPSPVLSVSFQPIGSPVTYGINSEGRLSVSMGDSIATPLGTMTIAASQTTSSPTSPHRLIVKAGLHQRVLLMDRPFEVFVPSEYGVSIINDGQQLTVNVLSRGEAKVSDKDWTLWLAGVPHPQYPNVIASKEPQKWYPAPGYSPADNSNPKDMRVVWTPGQRHPDYEHVVAAAEEGWNPEKGWKWKNDDPSDFSVMPE